MPELLERYAASRDPLLFEAVDQALRAEAIRFAARVVHDRALAEDVAQEALIELARRTGEAPWRDFEGWWRGRLRNGARMARRASRLRERGENAAARARGERWLEPAAEVVWLHEIMEGGALPWADAIRLILRGFTHAEAARALGRPKGTVDRWCLESTRWLRERAGLRLQDAHFHRCKRASRSNGPCRDATGETSMGTSLNHSTAGSIGWASDVDANWTTLESSFVARRQSDASSVTVTGTTSETVLMNNTTIPANALAAGSVIPVWAGGTATIPASSTPTLTFRLRWGGISGVVLASYAFTYTSSGSSRTVGWITDHRIFGVTAGASGTAYPEGFFMISGSVEETLTALVTSTTVIDTTTSKALVWTVQPSLSTVTVVQRGMVTDAN